MMETAGDEKATTVAIFRDGFDRVLESVETLLGRPDPLLLAYRPGPQANHIAWLIWHLSRVQDDHFTHLANALWPDAGTEQRWVAEDWVSVLNLPYSKLDTGYAHSSEQVGSFGTYDANKLLGYHRAVHTFSNGILGKLSTNDFGTVVDRRWDPPVTAAVRLASILNDTTQHVGQASYVHGLFASEP